VCPVEEHERGVETVQGDAVAQRRAASGFDPQCCAWLTRAEPTVQRCEQVLSESVGCADGCSAVYSFVTRFCFIMRGITVRPDRRQAAHLLIDRPIPDCFHHRIANVSIRYMMFHSRG
jgi:hypothetical protein